nr:hypothetical protein [Glycomyces arizonensis]
MPDGVLDPRGEHDDAEQHRNERVRESVEDLPDPLHLVARLGQRLLGPRHLVDEQRPPQAGGDGEAEDRREEQIAVERQPRGPDADGHHRLAEGDDDDQAVALGDVPRVQGEPLLVVKDRDRPHDDGRERPQQVPPQPLGAQLGGEDGGDGGHVGDEDRPDRLGGLEVHQAVDDHDDEHAHGDPDLALLEGDRDAHADQQPAGHGDQDEDAARRAHRRDHVRQPAVTGEHPPQEPEHEHRLEEAGERVVGDQGGELGDDEDEDEVEEDLQRADPQLVFVLGRFDVLHEPLRESVCEHAQY